MVTSLNASARMEIVCQTQSQPTDGFAALVHALSEIVNFSFSIGSSGDGKANQIIAKQGVAVVGGASHDISIGVAAAEENPHGEDAVFDEVYLVYIRNASTTAAVFRLNAHPSADWTMGPFGVGTVQGLLPAGAACLFVNPNEDNWVVGTNEILRLTETETLAGILDYVIIGRKI